MVNYFHNELKLHSKFIYIYTLYFKKTLTFVKGETFLFDPNVIKLPDFVPAVCETILPLPTLIFVSSFSIG